MPEPLSAEREVEIRAHIERERGWSVGADMATDLLSAHDYHRAAATRAQAELERVTRERDAVTRRECEYRDRLIAAQEGVISDFNGEYMDWAVQRDTLNTQLAALQSRNAALEAELAQARERERGLREALEAIPRSHPNTPSNNKMESVEAGREVGWQDCRVEVSKVLAQAALDGGKEGA